MSTTPFAVGGVDERVRLRSGRSLIGTAVGGGHGRGDVGRDKKAADAIEDALPGRSATRHGHLLRGLGVDERHLGWSPVGGDGPEDVAAFRLPSQREASRIESRSEVVGLHQELSSAAFVVEREGLDLLLKVEVGLNSVLLVEFLDDVVRVGVVSDKGTGVASDQVVEETKEEAPLFSIRGAGVRERSRVSWIRKRSIANRNLLEK